MNLQPSNYRNCDLHGKEDSGADDELEYVLQRLHSSQQHLVLCLLIGIVYIGFQDCYQLAEGIKNTEINAIYFFTVKMFTQNNKNTRSDAINIICVGVVYAYLKSSVLLSVC